MATSLSSRSSVASVHPTRQQLDELDALLQRMLDVPVNRVEEEPAADALPPRVPRVNHTVDVTEEPERPAPLAERLPTMPPPMTDDLDSIGPRVVDGTPPEPEHDDSASEDSEAWVPLRSSWQPSAQTWGPLAKQWQAQQSRPTVRKSRKGSLPEEEEGGGPREERRAPRAEAQDSREEARTARPLPTSWQADARAAQESTAQAAARSVESVAPSGGASPSPEAAPTPILLWPFHAVDVLFDRVLALGGPLTRPLRSPGGKAVLAFVGVLSLLGAVALLAVDWFGWTW